MKRLIRGSKGQALVEMALVLPIFILLLLGIMEFGRLFSGYMELQNLARDAVRHATVNVAMKTVTDVKPWIESRLITLNKEKLTITFSRPDVTVNSKKEEHVSITLEYKMDILTPIISSILGNPYTLRSEMVMRSEVET